MYAGKMLSILLSLTIIGFLMIYFNASINEITAKTTERVRQNDTHSK